MAQVVLEENADPKDVRRQIRKYARQKLDGYKVPAKIEWVDKTNFGERFKKNRL